MKMCILCEKDFEPTQYAVCPKCYVALEAERWEINTETSHKHNEYDENRKRAKREGNCAKKGCQKPMFARRLCRSHYEQMMLPVWRESKKKRNQARRQIIKEETVVNTDDLWQFVIQTLKKEGHEIGAKL